MDADAYATTSDDRDERINARRLRIDARNASRNDEGKSKSRDAPELQELSIGKQQVRASLEMLDKLKSSTVENVTQIRLEADRNENERRVQEEKLLQGRLHALQREAVESGTQNAAVEVKWSDVLGKDRPEELDAEIEAQQEICKSIIHNKKVLIAQFKDAIKAKDEEYVATLKNQAAEIDEVLKRMVSQYQSLESTYEKELENIENEFLRERQQIMETNKGEIDSLFQKRRSSELEYMEKRQDTSEANQREIESLRTKDAEDYNKTKVKLETDIQTLEQQLEEMRATYQLNTEKLEYNFRVLTERDLENTATLGQQKRKLTRLKDSLSSIIAKYNRTDNKYKQENTELTDEYRRITKQYKDLQSKFEHFETADNKKYEEVWAMHEDEANELISSLHDADRIIHDQILGVEWTPPDDLLKGEGKRQEASESKHEDADESKQAEPESESKTADGEAVAAGKKMADAVSNEKVKHMLELLCSEASFLISPDLRKKLNSMNDDDAAVLKADAILKILGVEDESDVEMLLSYFFDETMEIDEEMLLDRSMSPEERIKNLGLKINPDAVVKVVKEFVEEKKSMDSSETATLRVNHNPSTAKMSQKRDAEGKVAAFWKGIANSIPEKSVRVWKALERSLTDYNEILQQRAGLVDNIASLRQQNVELSVLLQQYLNDKVVDELVIPPTLMMHGVDPHRG